MSWRTVSASVSIHSFLEQSVCARGGACSGLPRRRGDQLSGRLDHFMAAVSQPLPWDGAACRDAAPAFSRISAGHPQARLGNISGAGSLKKFYRRRTASGQNSPEAQRGNRPNFGRSLGQVTPKPGQLSPISALGRTDSNCTPIAPKFGRRVTALQRRILATARPTQERIAGATRRWRRRTPSSQVLGRGSR